MARKQRPHINQRSKADNFNAMYGQEYRQMSLEGVSTAFPLELESYKAYPVGNLRVFMEAKGWKCVFATDYSRKDTLLSWPSKVIRRSGGGHARVDIQVASIGKLINHSHSGDVYPPASVPGWYMHWLQHHAPTPKIL